MVSEPFDIDFHTFLVLLDCLIFKFFVFWLKNGLFWKKNGRFWKKNGVFSKKNRVFRRFFSDLKILNFIEKHCSFPETLFIGGGSRRFTAALGSSRTGSRTAKVVVPISITVLVPISITVLVQRSRSPFSSSDLVHRSRLCSACSRPARQDLAHARQFSSSSISDLVHLDQSSRVFPDRRFSSSATPDERPELTSVFSAAFSASSAAISAL